jgi:stringent starvation protein B
MTRDDEQGSSSTKPYLIRALHEWCTDNGFAPHIAVRVDATVRVPHEFVKNDEIVLNVGFEATNALRLGNEFIEFKARFGGIAREVIVPITHVIAIYARENGQGMAFPPPENVGSVAQKIEPVEADTSLEVTERSPLRSVPTDASADTPDDGSEPPPDGGPTGRGGRPQLKRVK